MSEYSDKHRQYLEARKELDTLRIKGYRLELIVNTLRRDLEILKEKEDK